MKNPAQVVVSFFGVLAIAGCHVEMVEGQLECEVTADCPGDWVCSPADGRCYSDDSSFPAGGAEAELDSEEKLGGVDPNDTGTGSDTDTGTGSDTDTGTGSDTDTGTGSDTDTGLLPENVIAVDHRSTATAPTGRTWESAFSSVQAGIDAAEAGFGVWEVWVVGGIYSIHQGEASDTLLLKAQVNVYGGFSGSESVREERSFQDHETILDGEDQVSHVVTGANNALLDGFVITGGYAGIVTDSSDTGLESGGGLYNNSTSPTVANCTFRGNRGKWGGAISNRKSQTVIRNSVFFENRAEYGSAVYSVDLDVVGSVVSIENSLFYGNESGNDATIYLYDSSIELVGATFVGNYATDAGGAVYLAAGSNMVASSSIFWGDSAARGSEIFIADEGVSTVRISYSDVAGGYEGKGNIDSDPLFEDADQDDYSLSAGSPCIDAGDGLVAPAADLEGKERADSADAVNAGQGPPWADMGAFESSFP